ncbi:MAG: hypothetical protein WCV41_00450 [Patescibacteria group bacterium]
MKISKSNKITFFTFVLLIFITIFLYFYYNKDLALFIAFFVLLFKDIIEKYIKQLFEKDLENFKLEGQKELIKFETSYKKRREIIEEFNKKLNKIMSSYRPLLSVYLLNSGEKDMQGKWLEASNTFDEMTNYYNENKIHLNEDLINGIEKFIKNFLNQHIFMVYYTQTVTILDNNEVRRLNVYEIKNGVEKILKDIDYNFLEVEKIIKKNFDI